jgi:hypothetical protein
VLRPSECATLLESRRTALSFKVLRQLHFCTRLLPCTYDIPIWIHRAVCLSRGSCLAAGAVRRTRSGRLDLPFLGRLGQSKNRLAGGQATSHGVKCLAWERIALYHA